MAVIHIFSVDAATERAIKNKQYSEKQVFELNNRMQADNKKKEKVFRVVMVTFSVFLFAYGGIILIKAFGIPGAIPLIFSFIPVIAIVGFATWFAAIGYIMHQWNNLIRVYYPEVYTMSRIKADTSDTTDTTDTPVAADKSDEPEKKENTDFAALEKDIEQLNKINVKANYTSRDRYNSLYKSIYERLLEMDAKGEIVLEPGTKGLGYLQELLINDGPEFSYTIRFWRKGNRFKRYRIGVCVRGLPICKPDNS